MGSLRACLSRHNDVLNKGQRGKSPFRIFTPTGKEEEACGSFYINESLAETWASNSCRFLLGAAKLLGLPWSMGAKCWPPSATAALSRLLQRPLQSLSKAFQGDPYLGRSSDRTLTWASVQTTGVNKRGFSYQRAATLGLSQRIFFFFNPSVFSWRAETVYPKHSLHMGISLPICAQGFITLL